MQKIHTPVTHLIRKRVDIIKLQTPTPLAQASSEPSTSSLDLLLVDLLRDRHGLLNLANLAADSTSTVVLSSTLAHQSNPTSLQSRSSTNLASDNLADLTQPHLGIQDLSLQNLLGKVVDVSDLAVLSVRAEDVDRLAERLRSRGGTAQHLGVSANAKLANVDRLVRVLSEELLDLVSDLASQFGPRAESHDNSPISGPRQAWPWRQQRPRRRSCRIALEVAAS